MTQTKVIGESVKQTNRSFVKAYANDYAKAITKNYFDYHMNQLTREGHPHPDYANEQIAEIENGTANLMKFEIREGRKYYKVVQVEFETWNGSPYFQQYRDRSVHSFVDKETGEVFKPASWNRPAKHVRFTFQKPEHIRFLLDSRNVDWAGGYLYMR